MPRSGERARHGLRAAALELYRERGYERATTAEIAARAGVTERTFFRHFLDKREVLFDGEAALSTVLAGSIREAPATLGPWATLLSAFQAAVPLLVKNRSFSEPRRRIIAGHPALQEREVAKMRSLVGMLAFELQKRGVPSRQATLAAWMGLAAQAQAVSVWLDEGPDDLGHHLAQAFRDVRELSSEA